MTMRNKLVLIIEGLENDRIIDEIKNLKSLSKFEIPKKIVYLKKFVFTETQKINRIETLKLLKNIC